MLVHTRGKRNNVVDNLGREDIKLARARREKTFAENLWRDIRLGNEGNVLAGHYIDGRGERLREGTFTLKDTAGLWAGEHSTNDDAQMEPKHAHCWWGRVRLLRRVRE